MIVDIYKMSNDELASLIHELNDELEHRCNNLSQGSWLKRQLDSASLTFKSWSSSMQRNSYFG